jgi:hypothetical protein
MNSEIMEKGVFFLIFILISLMGLLAVNIFNTENKVLDAFSIKNTSVFTENFSEGVLNHQTWQITQEGDFKKRIIDIYDVDPSENVDSRLKLGMNTIGTGDDTVKFLGVKSIEKVNLSDETKISFDLDWNNQSNGCYLTGSFYLCPTATSGNPEDENNWIKFEYIGVPPGQNARCVIANKVDGNTRIIYTDGWPEDRIGRRIEDQHIIMVLDNKSLKVQENGIELNTPLLNDLNLTSAYIYLQMSSHSNYPLREIYFDNITITNT